MAIDKSAAMAVNSMGIGSVLSFVTFIPTYIGSQFNLLPEVLVKIVTILINTPTEILSFGVGILTANGIGAEWMEKFLSTDSMKNKQMVRLIFDKSIEQLKDHKHEFRKIDERQVYEIFHPKLAFTYGFGQGIVNTMNWTSKKLTEGYSLITGQPVPKTLFDKINLSNMALTNYNGDF